VMHTKLWEMEFLKQVYWENDLRSWLLASALVLGIFLVLFLFKKYLMRKKHMVEKLSPRWVRFFEVFALALKKTRTYFIFFLALFIGSRFLTMAPSAVIIFERVFVFI